MQKYLIRRLLLVIPTLWLVISLLFLALRALPGDFVTRKLSNLESQSAEARTLEIVGQIVAENTTHRVLANETIESIAADYEITAAQLLDYNPQLADPAQLRPGFRAVVLPGERVGVLATRHRVVRPEDESDGIEQLIALNPGVELGYVGDDPYVPVGTDFKIRDSITISDLAHVYRITAEDILAVNPAGSPTNPDGLMTADYALMPGDEYREPSTKVTEALIQNRLGIDKPLGVQYYEFLWDTITFDFAPSFQTRESSMDLFLRSLPRTLHLNVYALVVAIIIAIPVGVISAIRQDSAADYTLRGFAILMLAAPSFWIATMMIYVVTPGGIFDGGIFSIPLASEDARSVFSDFRGALALYSIPAIAGGLAAGAGLMRITRSEMLEVLRQDYVRTAQSKGLRERSVVLRHAFRNALVPVLSVFGVVVATLVGGNIILEVLFNIPGIGLLLWQRIQQADIPVVQTTVFFLALFVIILNILIDVTYAFVDPRIRYS